MKSLCFSFFFEEDVWGLVANEREQGDRGKESITLGFATVLKLRL